MTDPASTYVMGHTDQERRRLSIQAALLNPLTERFLSRSGLSAGMHVLELGCGVGEVSLIAARLVGPYGHVHCIDIDSDALEIASDRVRSAGHNHVSFDHIDLSRHSPARPYDAVIGRHILVHTKDALEVLRQAVSVVRTGGLIAFQEYDLSFYPRGFPELPLMFRTEELIVEFFRRGVPKANIGMQLFHLMQEAGLPPPECCVDGVTGGGPHSLVYEWLGETVRSLLPRMEALGMTTAAEVRGETLVQRLRDEAVEKRGVVVGPLMIGAFARKPNSSIT